MVGVYKCLSLNAGVAVTVAIWRREVVSCRDFILRAVATFWAMSLVGVYAVGSHTPLGTATAAKTSLLKWNERVFKLCRVYSNLLKMSNIDKFSWPDDTQVQKERENFAVACLRPL